MQIEEGKYYRDVGGVKRGPATPSGMDDWPWDLGENSGFYLNDGQCPHIPSEDLVAEWVEGERTPQMTNPTNTDLAAALREIADILPLGSALVVRLAADRLSTVDGWIEWDATAPDAGDGPDTGDSPLDVRLRDGTQFVSDGDCKSAYLWSDLEDDTTITHYRLSRN